MSRYFRLKVKCRESDCDRRAIYGCDGYCSGCRSSLRRYGGPRLCFGCGRPVIRNYNRGQYAGRFILCQSCFVMRGQRPKGSYSSVNFCWSCQGWFGEPIATGLCRSCWAAFHRNPKQQCAICLSRRRIFDKYCQVCWVLLVRLILSYQKRGWGYRRIAARLLYLDSCTIYRFLRDCQKLQEDDQIPNRVRSSRRLRLRIVRSIQTQGGEFDRNLKEYLSRSKITNARFHQLASQLLVELAKLSGAAT